MSLIVSLEEFAELVGVTPETMRVHLKQVDGQPDWLVERGDRGRAYKIEAEGAVAWWQEKREAEDLLEAERKGQLQQLRLGLGVAAAEGDKPLTLSGRQRREEYGAAMEALKYRKTMGELVEKAELDHVFLPAVVELRRRLMLVPGEFVIAQGLPGHHVQVLEGMLARAIDGFVSKVEADAAAG